MSQIATPEQLKAAYAYQFAHPIDQWAFGFARGWFPLIVRACEAIDELVREDQYRHRFHWLQIKEKFGTLRLYWKARRSKDRDAIVAARIAQITRAAEEESARTCMACGAAGTLRRGGWFLTLCDEHAQQSKLGKELDMWLPSDVPDAGQA